MGTTKGDSFKCFLDCYYYFRTKTYFVCSSSRTTCPKIRFIFYTVFLYSKVSGLTCLEEVIYTIPVKHKPTDFGKMSKMSTVIF